MATEFQQERMGIAMLLGQLRLRKKIGLRRLAIVTGIETNNLSAILNGMRAASFEQLKYIALALCWDLEVDLVINLQPHDLTKRVPKVLGVSKLELPPEG